MKRIFSIIILSLFVPLFAHASTGGILSGFNLTKVCHDPTCTSPTPGILNWKPTTGTTVTIDSVTGLSGMIWGNELGWVNLNPTGAGVIFADPLTGVLTGKAWSQVSGWINFAPTGQQVSIDPSTGQFSGYAWTGGPLGGWIKFDCGSSDTCIKTDWRPPAPSSGGGGGGGGGGFLPDVCPNFPGWQGVIPAGDTVDANGNCIPVIDYCPNIDGLQSQVPSGFVVNASGACVPNTIDYCPNIAGTQTTVPSGYIISGSRGCVKAPLDACPDTAGTQSSTLECGHADVCLNLSGVQEVVPPGYVVDDGSCVPETFDLCSNIDGNQASLPEGMVLSNDGTCASEPSDLCPNLGGYQDTVPKGFVVKDGMCLFEAAIDTSSDESVVSYSFIPDSLKLPSDNAFLKSIARKLSLNTTEPFSVDLVSATISLLLLIIIIVLAVRLIRRF